MSPANNMEPQMTEKLYDLKQLKEVVGSSEFLVSLANIFLSTIPLSSKQMLEAIQAEDWPLVSKIAHKIKPTIDSMNIASIRSDIRTLEINAKNKVSTDILGKIAVKVDEVINIVAQQLKSEYNL